MSVITLQDVHKIYPLGKQKVEAVKGVSFGIEKGEFAAISGPSGSGKSTILNMVGLIDLPSSGKIIIDGIDETYNAFVEIIPVNCEIIPKNDNSNDIILPTPIVPLLTLPAPITTTIYPETVMIASFIFLWFELL